MDSINVVQPNMANVPSSAVGSYNASSSPNAESGSNFFTFLGEAAAGAQDVTDAELVETTETLLDENLGNELQEALWEQVSLLLQQPQQVQMKAELELSLEQWAMLGVAEVTSSDPEFVTINYSQSINGEIDTANGTMVEQVLDGLAPLMPKVDSEVSHDMEELASAILAYADPSKPAPKVSQLPRATEDNTRATDNNVTNNESEIETASSLPQAHEEVFVPTGRVVSSELLDDLARTAQAVAEQTTQQNIPQALEALLSNTTTPNELKHQVTPLEEKLLSMNQHAQAPNYLKPGEIEVSPKDQLLAKVQQLANTGVKQVTMQLHPAELGEVTVQMDWDENEALSKVTFLVEKAESFELLQKEAGKLAIALTEQRLISDQASLRLVMQSDNHGSNSNFAGHNGNNQNFANSNSQHKHQGIAPTSYASASGRGVAPALSSMLADGYVDILV